MLNKVSIMGRLVRDPELRRTQSGIAVTTVRIAVDRDFKGQDGSKQADFFDIVAWRNTAEFVSRYFTKGRMMIVDGRLQNRDWEDRDGNKRVTTEIVADNIYFGDSKRDAYGDGSGYGGNSGYGASGYGGYGASAPGYGGASYGNNPPAYGGGNPAYGANNSAPGYGGGNPAYGANNAVSSPAPGYGGGNPAYTGNPQNAAPADSGYSVPENLPQSDFAELGDEDGDLPF